MHFTITFKFVTLKTERREVDVGSSIRKIKKITRKFAKRESTNRHRKFRDADHCDTYNFINYVGVSMHR